MDTHAQVRRLLAKSTEGDMLASFKMFDKMLTSIHENIALVDCRHYRWDKYIHEMSETEYAEYQNFLEDIQVQGANLFEYFHGFV